MLSISKYACVPVLVLILIFINVTESLSVQSNRKQESGLQTANNHQSLESIIRVRRAYIDENENCGPQDLEMVHTIMDRICMLCHELRSHFAPNTRVECRKDCFRNTTFQSCMKIFSGVSPQHVRHHAEPTAPIPLYTEEVQTLDDIKERRRRI
ncbi:unnamed protein product [Caenorhabditis sp. 36 PRJEB53466]|nr:unnamed protein product [Caenorhabditis sp. 36 PRJEB53466]